MNYYQGDPRWSDLSETEKQLHAQLNQKRTPIEYQLDRIEQMLSELLRKTDAKPNFEEKKEEVKP